MSKTDLFEQNTQKRIKELEKTIIALDTAFHVTGDDCIDPFTGEVVLDNEYDALKKELENLHPTSKIFKDVTAAKSSKIKNKIIHDPPMTSINKCNGTEKEKEAILMKFFEDCRKIDKDIASQKSYPVWLEKFFTMSYKHDGLALSCEYENGDLKRVGLRSKSGQDGIDVTDLAKYIAGIPQNLKDPVTCKIRGEVETPISDFIRVSEELGDDAKANPRAHTAGSMNHKTAKKMKDRGLRFTAYNVVGIKNPPYKTEIERAKWTSKLGFHYVKTIPFTFDMLKTFEDQHRRLNFMVDGAVISIGNLELQKQMGQSGSKLTGNPKGKIAFKFKDEIKTAIVKDITWQTGRTGNITPVLIFDGIQLEGTTVSKCTAHNLGMIKTHKIGIGSEIEIIKSGKIIPKINKVIKAKGSAKIPTNCPSCGERLLEVDGSDGALSLICDNSDCSAQNVKSLNHWMKVLGVKGIAGSTIEKLIDAGLIRKRSDFYKLTLGTLLNNGITERTAVLILARIWMIPSPEQEKDNVVLRNKLKPILKINIPTEKFFAAFGIKEAGKEVGRLLSQQYQDFNEIRNLTISELESIDGIGSITAKNTVDFLTKNKHEIDQLLQFITLESAKNKGGKLDGQVFVLSGSIEGGKDLWKESIEEQGGIVKSSVSKKTNYLVAGDGSGSKSDKAEELNIPILTVDDLEKMIDD
jgi:DNA ligase (NAD+)